MYLVRVDSLLDADLEHPFQELAIDSAPPDQVLLVPVKGNILSIQ